MLFFTQSNETREKFLKTEKCDCINIIVGRRTRWIQVTMWHHFLFCFKTWLGFRLPVALCQRLRSRGRWQRITRPSSWLLIHSDQMRGCGCSHSAGGCWIGEWCWGCSSFLLYVRLLNLRLGFFCFVGVFLMGLFLTLGDSLLQPLTAASMV